MPESGEINHVFEHAWDDVTRANWIKYPSNDRPDLTRSSLAVICPGMLQRSLTAKLQVAVDVLDTQFDPDTQLLKVKRLFIIKNLGYPDWMVKVLGDSIGLFEEETTVDMRQRQMQLINRNISFSSIMEVTETCTYTPCKERPNVHTHFKQEARIQAFPFGVSWLIERFCVSKFMSNAHRGREVMEDAIRRVKTMAKPIAAQFENKKE